MSYQWFYELAHAFSRINDVNNVAPMYRNAFQLFHHERRQKIRRIAFSGYTLVETKERMDGITKVIEEIFYPMQSSEPTDGAKTGGSSRGNMTDKQLAAIVNKGEIPSEISPYTKRVLDYLYRHKMKPFACQYIVYDETLRLATELDILAVYIDGKHTDNVVNIQLKTGYNKNYEKGKNMMTSLYVPDSKLSMIEKTHKSTHQLQNLVEHMITMLNYNSLLRESVVLVISETETKNKEQITHDALYRIDPRLRELREDIYLNLKSRLGSSKIEQTRMAAEESAVTREIRNKFV